MSNKRITDLSELTTPTTDDVLPIVDIASNTTQKVQVGNLPTTTAVTNALATKQETLVSGTNIKTLEGQSLLGSGNIDLVKGDVGLGNVDNTSDANKPVSTATQTALDAKQDTLVSGTNIKTINSTSLLGSGDVAVQETLVSGTNIKTINSTSLLGSGDIVISANPSGGAGAIQFSDGSAFASDAANLFWDDANNRLGVGINAPTVPFDVNGNVRFRNNVNLNGQIFNVNSGIVDVNGILYANAVTNGVGVGISAPTARLQVRGSGTTLATTALLVQNSAGVNAIKVTDNLVTEIGNQLNIVRTNVTDQLIEINANFGTIAAGIRAGGNSKDFILSAKDGKDLYLSTTFATGITQVQFALKHNQGVLIKDNASTAIAASAKLEISSTTQGFLPPRMTTTEKNAISSPAAGLVVYDTTLNKLCVYTTAWETITSL
jgi:hypothetical protein